MPTASDVAGASECRLSDELRKSLARARKVEDDPTRTARSQVLRRKGATSAGLV